ncbi:methyl-accepting chemotaxis protein [Marinomonas sp. M1K-6]|uniref:Methyl-accepting chemotaxis protein n=1 Tax=Marinomonas profundi TaxID=2726122 RepID=A0A847QZU0_9GAMM|nr:methyl-accepting chemotaxis protein [Marinomonas profundi]NLQ16631.1 methyl-accepting chemotaxis protein [Marinomonas profundi]UDV03787.1 methyl-accepting chemotaxis protein [Marinomonas profundi]
MIRNIKLGMRSALAFGVLGVITLFMGGFSVYQLDALNDVTEVLTKHRMPALNTAAQLRRDVLQVRVLVGDLSDAETSKDVQDIVNRINVVNKVYQKNSGIMASLARSDNAKAIFANVKTSHQTFLERLPELYRLIGAEGVDNRAAVNYRRDTVVPVVDALLEELNKLSAYQLTRAEDTNIDATEAYLDSRHALIAISAITIVLLVLIAIFYSRSLLLPIRQAVDMAKSIANGDLTVSFKDPHKDEAAEMLNTLEAMKTQLHNTISLIGDSSSQLASTSEELSVVTNQSTQVVTQQSGQLEQAATAVTELTTAIEEVARSANSTSENAEEADEKTQLGQMKVNETIKTIELLATEIEQSVQHVSTLAASVKNIGSVLDVIRGIADQTNLLALNAAIEAARAGETGRGFAVVADEVRALAHRTQSSTLEIEQLIQSVQDQTSRTVSNMQSSNQRAVATLSVANEAGATFIEITKLISQINDQNLTIASAAEQQAMVAREVDKNLLDIRDLSMQTAAGANQTSASSNELAGLAENLNKLVMKFKL